MIGLKKYQKFIKALAAFLVLVVFCIPLIGSGTSKNDTVRVLNPILNAPFNKELIITFGGQLKANTVNSKNVYVTDYKNVRVPVKISTGSDGKSIIILPQKNYECGKTYMLYVTGNVCYKNGKRTGILIKRLFTISNNKELTDLPLVGSIDNLKKLLSESDDYNSRVYYTDGIINGAAQKSASTQSETNTDYSKTNLQVAGVDEADTVKTDGNYIYEVSNNKVFIVKTNDGKMDIESTINYNNDFNPNEIYIDGNCMVVIGNSYYGIPVIYNDLNKDSAVKKSSIAPVNYGCVKTLVYDITDRKNPKLQREYEIEGNYVSSRKIGNNVYLVSNKYQYYYEVQNGGNITPSYRDTSKSNNFINIGCDKIRYFPGFVRSCFMTISGIDISNPSKPVDMATYLGSGDEIYASEKNLYVAVTHYVKVNKGTIIQRIANSTGTDIYKFGLNDGKAGYIAKSEIKGTVLNQFSMDEYNGYFRIAATSGDIWESNENTSKNNVYVFDDMMNLKGKIEGMAPGEKIYSVRFMGDKGYVVTFKAVDPLFVIDLKNPAAPKILGALKIPGYSNYIEPYDENHIIGFGKDAVEGTTKDPNGINSTAYYMGMKVALFDVTDFSNPKVMYEEKIGDRGTDSEILYNHKALLFSKEKNLLAFPVTVMEAANSNSSSTVPSYGTFTFQGAYVYNISLSNGFVLKGKITHLTQEDYLKSGDNWYNSNKNITRVLYIGNNIYTISNSMIKANRMTDLAETGSIATE